jgi:hypothetical protein
MSQVNTCNDCNEGTHHRGIDVKDCECNCEGSFPRVSASIPDSVVFIQPPPVT